MTVHQADDFELEYVAADGGRRRERLRLCWHVSFEDVLPVRRFPSYRGQRNYSGRWCFATTSRHVGYESWLERERVMLLDFDPGVTGLASQPFWLHWDGGKHAPDYFARHTDGAVTVIDVRAADQIRPEDRVKFDMTARACGLAGWSYEVCGEVAPVLTANLHLLAGYARPWFRDDGTAQRLIALLDGPRPLRDLAEQVGQPIMVLPTLFHLMWSGEIAADLHTEVLGEDSPVWLGELR